MTSLIDDQLLRYFGTTDLSAVCQDTLESGVARMRVDFGVEEDRGRRFALWTVMYLLGAAPDIDVAFENRRDRDVARTFMELMK